MADWGLFELNATLDATLLANLSPEDARLYVTEHILRVAFEAIPQILKRCRRGASHGGTKTANLQEENNMKPGIRSGGTLLILLK